MHESESPREYVERDPQNDPRRPQADEIVIDRKPIIADQPRKDNWPTVPVERRRSERRRIERVGTDI